MLIDYLHLITNYAHNNRIKLKIKWLHLKLREKRVRLTFINLLKSMHFSYTRTYVYHTDINIKYVSIPMRKMFI